MKKIKYIKAILMLLVCSLLLTTSNICTDIAKAQPVQTIQSVNIENNTNITSLSIVENPKKYLNKTVTFNAKFDKFSTLGLDYKPAYRSSEEYISFLIKRDDTVYDIPLSEMKLFIKRDIAEKHIDLKTNDVIQVSGVLFSDALGDAWIDVNNLVLIKKSPENKDGV